MASWRTKTCCKCEGCQGCKSGIDKDKLGVSELLHGSPKALYIAGRVCSCFLTVRVKDFAR